MKIIKILSVLGIPKELLEGIKLYFGPYRVKGQFPIRLALGKPQKNYSINGKAIKA